MEKTRPAAITARRGILRGMNCRDMTEREAGICCATEQTRRCRISPKRFWKAGTAGTRRSEKFSRIRHFRFSGRNGTGTVLPTGPMTAWRHRCIFMKPVRRTSGTSTIWRTPDGSPGRRMWVARAISLRLQIRMASSLSTTEGLR